jgi:hypothetical protein
MNSLFDPHPMDIIVDRYIRWVKTCCPTIENARKSRPARSCQGHVAQIGGYCNGVKLNPGDVLIIMGGEASTYSLKEVWERCGVTTEYEPWGDISADSN